jgi:hypothetical protein
LYGRTSKACPVLWCISAGNFRGLLVEQDVDGGEAAVARAVGGLPDALDCWVASFICLALDRVEGDDNGGAPLAVLRVSRDGRGKILQPAGILGEIGTSLVDVYRRGVGGRCVKISLGTVGRVTIKPRTHMKKMA